MARYGNICLGPADQNLSSMSRDAIASDAIMPGSVCVLNSSGQFAVHATENGGADTILYIANYNYFQGLDADDANPINDTMEGLRPFDDGEFAVLLENGQNVTELDTALTSAGDGSLQIATVGTHDVLFYANEVFNNNTGSAALIRVRKA